MRNCYALFVIVVLLFAISGCGIKDGEANFKPETEKTTIQSPEPPSPIYDSIEYWNIVHDEIVAMLNEHNLYVSAINSSYPCVLYEVEPGIRTEDGQIMVSGLSQEEYEKLYLHIKEELHTILDKYVLAKPKTAFHACDSVVGIYFKNWFIDMPMLPGVNSWQVASYELDLLEYYHEYEDNSYTNKDGFHAEVWSKYVVYVP